MVVFVKGQTQVEVREYRHFSQGYEAGLANPINKSEIATIVKTLSTLPVDEWLSTETLEYSVGLLAGWLPELAPDIVSQLTALAPVPDQTR